MRWSQVLRHAPELGDSALIPKRGMKERFGR